MVNIWKTVNSLNQFANNICEVPNRLKIKQTSQYVMVNIWKTVISLNQFANNICEVSVTNGKSFKVKRLQIYCCGVDVSVL